MCSWCWGFHSTFTQLKQAIASKLRITFVLGGLAPDSSEPMPEQMRLMLRDTWRTIQTKVPGTEFNFDFWAKCAPRRSTYPACRAVIAAKNQRPEIEDDMIVAIQRAYYLNAQNPSDDDTLIAIVDSLELNTDLFSADLHSDQTQVRLLHEIALSQRLGVQGFPSLVLNTGNNNHPIPIDYNSADVILARINQIDGA